MKKIIIILHILLSFYTIYSYEIDSFNHLYELTDAIYLDLEAKKENIKLPSLVELKEAELLSNRRLNNLAPVDLWHETHAMASLQSYYLEEINDYSTEFVYISVLQYKSRKKSYEGQKNIDSEDEATLNYILNQISNELVGISHYYVRLMNIISVKDRNLLIDEIIIMSEFFMPLLHSSSKTGLVYGIQNIYKYEKNELIRDKVKQHMEFMNNRNKDIQS